LRTFFLQQTEERLHGSVVAGRADLARRAEHPVPGQRLLQLPCSKLAAAFGVCRTQPATDSPVAAHRATALSSAATVIEDSIRSLIE
jgi:hypothetical protein